MLLTNLKSFIATHRTDGRGEAFGFDDITTETYLKWAFGGGNVRIIQKYKTA